MKLSGNILRSSFLVNTVKMVFVGFLFYSVINRAPIHILAIFLLLVSGVVLIIRIFRISLPLFLLLALLFSNLFLNLYDIGPFSPKNYIIVIVCILLGVKMAVSRENPFRSKMAYKLFFIYSLFILCVIFTDLFNGRALLDIMREVPARHFSAIVIFLITQYYLRTWREIKIMALFMGITVLLSGTVAIMQMYDVSLAWAIRATLYPRGQLLIALGGDRLENVGYSAGLSLSSIQFTYHLSAFGTLLVSWIISIISSSLEKFFS